MVVGVSCASGQDEHSLGSNDEPDGDPALPAGLSAEPLDNVDEELPVVARLVVEIRSDGQRTVARGALDDRASGQTVALKLDAGSPLDLVRRLGRVVLTLPSLGRGRGDEEAKPARRSLRGAVRRSLARLRGDSK